MECEFCGRELHLSHMENNNEISVYDCVHCPVLTSFFFMHKEGSRLKTSFLIDKNGKSYIWTNNYINSNSYISDVSIDRSVMKDPLLVKFPKIMNINPKNVREKFSFYMVFI